MQLEEVVKLIYGQVLTENVDLRAEVEGGCGADLMSDVLASVQPQAVLLTGLCNPQVVRTAQMADVAAVVFVRGKMPDAGCHRSGKRGKDSADHHALRHVRTLRTVV